MSTIYAGVQGQLEVALCDCCDQRPGTRMIVACGIETWVCDVCDVCSECEEEDVPETSYKPVTQCLCGDTIACYGAYHLKGCPLRPVA